MFTVTRLHFTWHPLYLALLFLAVFGLSVAPAANSLAQPFVSINADLVAAENGASRWGDVDSDGDLDLIVTGDSDPTLLTSLSTRIYRNDGSGSFTVVDPGIKGTFNGSIDWGDIDGDDDLDVVITGNTGGSDFETVFFSAIYRNDGTSNFVRLNNSLPQVSTGSSEWGDFDNDGDLDLILTGVREDRLTTVSKIYRNDGTGAFTDVGALIARVQDSSTDWGDYDGDGDLDLLLTGEDENSDLQARIYRNDGSSGFIDIAAGLPGVRLGSARWGDFDADGDLDVLVSGSNVAEVHRNGGNGVFSLAQALFGVEESASRWADIDQDNDLDVIVRGDGSTLVYRNDGVSGFVPIGSKLPGGSNDSGSWGDVDGDGDPDLALTGRTTAIFENLRDQPVFKPVELPLTNVGSDDNSSFSVPGYASVASADYDNDGDPDFVITGLGKNQEPRTRLYRNDGGGFSVINAGLLNFASGSVSWADYDGDGDSDLLLMGISERSSLRDAALYRNDGNSSFTEVSTNIEGVRGGFAAWGDYDGDEDLDLVVTGESTAGFFGASPRTTLYKNESGTFTSVTTAIGRVSGDVQWGDYDSDGDLDLIASHDIYRNDGDDTFVSIDSGLIDLGATGVSDWGDYDGDGDLDLMLTLGPSSEFASPTAKIYRNNGTDAFTDIRSSITDVRISNGEWVDYDGDGDLDLLLVGEDETTGSNRVQSFLYTNEGGGNFERVESGLAGTLGDLEWVDFDSDGDLDVITVGSPLNRSGPLGQSTRLYVNQLNPAGAIASAEVRTDQVVQLPEVGMDISFGDETSGTGFVHARRLDVPLSQTDGIPESLAKSRYWVSIESTPTVTVSAGTDVLFDPGAFGGIGNPETVRVFQRSMSTTYAPGQFVEVTASDSPQNGQIIATVDGFGQFVFASDDMSNPLPVELTAFTASTSGESIDLTWSTASETNNAGFDIERSTDGETFTAIGFEPGVGTTEEAQSYRFVDREAPFATTLFYRLRQVDTDGTFEYSPVVEVEVTPSAVALLPVAPNPVSASARLRYELPEATAVRLQVFDLLGRRVATLADGEKPAGRHEVSWQGAGLASGTYFVRLQAGSTAQTQMLRLVR
jgi:hypothetical protein